MSFLWNMRKQLCTLIIVLRKTQRIWKLSYSDKWRGKTVTVPEWNDVEAMRNETLTCAIHYIVVYLYDWLGWRYATRIYEWFKNGSRASSVQGLCAKCIFHQLTQSCTSWWLLPKISGHPWVHCDKEKFLTGNSVYAPLILLFMVKLAAIT